MSNQEALPPLSTFVLKKILNERVQEKKIVVLGHFECDKEKEAVLIFEKSPFVSFDQEAFNCFSSLSQDFQNDIYAKLSATLDPNPITISSIYPATQKHISKHLHQPLHLHKETPSLYLSTTLPYIESIPPGQTSWVQNILDGTAEADKVVYSDNDPSTGSVVVVDLKWDQKHMDELYCVALIRDPKLRSIRDLRGEHLCLLKKMEQMKGFIAEKFGVEDSQIRAFFHYQPTYYRLHLHYTHIERKDLGAAIFLNDVIENISLFSDYYQKVSIEFSLGDAHPLSVLLNKERKRKKEEEQEH